MAEFKMADTVFVSIVDTGWTEISSSGPAGLFTNNGSQVIFLIESDSNPGTSVKNGHRLNITDYYRYLVLGSQKIFARSKKGAGSVAITPD